MSDDSNVEATRAPTQTGEKKRLLAFDELDDLFEHYLSKKWLHPFQFDFPNLKQVDMPFHGKMPKADIIDNESSIIVKVELPGVSKDDVDISLSKNAVTIKGVVKHESKEEKDNYFRSEITHGEISRTLRLPAEVQDDKAKAQFKDGLLTLTVPKVVPATPRSVPVK